MNYTKTFMIAEASDNHSGSLDMAFQ